MEIVKKIDIHVHASKAEYHSLFPSWISHRVCSGEELIHIYDQIGVEKAVILPWVSPEQSSLSGTANNLDTYMIVREHPDRFAWFANMDPRWGNNNGETDFVPFIEHFKSLGAKGIGEVSAGVYFDDPRAYALYRACAACDVPILFHIGTAEGAYGLIDEYNLPHLEKALQDNPDTIFLAHSQGFWSHISRDVDESTWRGWPTGKVKPGGRVVELMRKYPNLCGDISAGSGSGAIMRDPQFGYMFIEEFQDRLFYGTDICDPSHINSPMIKLAKFLDDAMLQGKISYDAYYKVSRGNAEKILNK